MVAMTKEVMDAIHDLNWELYEPKSADSLVLSPGALKRIDDESEFIKSLLPIAEELEAKARQTSECAKRLRDLITSSEEVIRRLKAGEWP